MALPDDPWSELPPSWVPDSRFDGGEAGCGEVILDLRIHFRPLPSGARVALLARDEGAPMEIPAWCRVTGHRLVASHHPYYLVEVRADHERENAR